MTSPQEQMAKHSKFFKAEFISLELRVSYLVDQKPHRGLKAQFALLFTHRWRENCWIHVVT